jgi:hypothetical protein
MAGTLEKLIADMRMAQGLTPDPLAEDLAPAATLPQDIRAPELSPSADAEIDASLVGIEPPVGSMLPEAAGLPPQADFTTGVPVDPFPAAPVTAQPVASGDVSRESESSSTIVGNRKYAQGGDALTPGAMGSIAKSVNPEAQAAQLALDEATTRRNDAVSLFEDQAALEAEGAMKEKQALAADDRIRQDEVARQIQFQAEAENRINEVDREVQEIAEREPDPSRFWSTRTAGQKALYMLTAALQAFSKPEEVPKVAEVLSKFIDQDVQIQEDRLARELAAAQGRGRSVRELITMGKEKDAAVYALRRGAVESLAKMLDADMRIKGAPLKAQESVQRANEALGMLSAGWYKEAAAGERSNREMIFRKQEAAKERAFRASQAEKERQAQASAPAESPQVNVAGIVGGIGDRGDGIVPNPWIKSAGDKLAEVAGGYQAGAKVISEGIAIVEKMKQSGRSPQLDSEWNAWVRRAQPVIARSSGHTGVLTEKDVQSAVAGSGYQVVGEDGFLSVEFLRNVRTNPDTAMRFLETLDSTAATKTEDRVRALAHPNQTGIRAKTAREYRDDEIVREREHEQAAKDDRGMAMAGMSRGGGTDYEKLYRKTAELLPFPGAKNVPAERAMQEVASQGRGNAATGETLTALYDAKSSLESAAKSAKSTADKVDLGIRLKRAEAGIYVIENTPEKTTPKQYAAELRRRAKFERGKLDMAKGGMGIGPTSKERVAELEKAADAYEAALKLATGTRN